MGLGPKGDRAATGGAADAVTAARRRVLFRRAGHAPCFPGGSGMTSAHQTRPPAFAPMAELSRALRTGETSSVILTKECLRRIAAHDAVFKSFLAVYEEEALAAAALADKELRAGQDRKSVV